MNLKLLEHSRKRRRRRRKMGLLACLGVISPFPFYYFLWNNPQSWVDLCGKGRDPCRFMALVSHFLKIVQFISLFSVATLYWPPPFFFWPLFFFGQFLNFRLISCLILLDVFENFSWVFAFWEIFLQLFKWNAWSLFSECFWLSEIGGSELNLDGYFEKIW